MRATASSAATVHNFEGSVSAAAFYYAVWPSLSAGTRCRLLRQIGPDPGGFGAKQRWVRTDPEDYFWGLAVNYGTNYDDVPYPSCP